MNTYYATLIRAALKIGGGVLVSKGLADEGTTETIIGGLVALFGVIWGMIASKGKGGSVPAGPVLLLLLPALLFTGCANFSTKQIDTSYDDQGKPARTITTQAKAYTFWESKSSLASFKATQTDKTQSASVGSLNQDSQASTNTANMAGQFLGELIRSAAKP